ncbi:MAG: EF-hand domain-containing protein [Planctomycetota bacterium]|jgi:Ca2+-binding EF-hand superfamily protein
MNSKFGMSVLAIALSFGCAEAFAQQGPPGGGQGRQQRDPGAMFERLDANADGNLTTDELGERFGRRLLDADGDDDGVISRAEFDAYMAKSPAQRILEKHDADKDGKLSADEIAGLDERVQGRIKDLDENGDGFVDEAELGKMRRGRRGGQRGRRGDRDGQKKDGDKDQGPGPNGSF